MIEFLNHLDISFFIYLNSLHNDFFDTVFLWVTEKYSWIFLYVIMLSLLTWRYMALRVQVFPNKGVSGIRLHMNKSYWPWLLLAVIFVLLVVAIGDQVSVHLFKNVFQRLRPSHEPDLAGLIHLPRRQGGLYGFVSGHATTSFALAYFSARIIGLRWYTRVIFMWAVVFSYSRIYIGVHYPGDSLFGALLGIFTGWLLLRVWVSIGNEWFPQLLPANLKAASMTLR
jgi:undecaprenyl-diphosphatase